MKKTVLLLFTLLTGMLTVQAEDGVSAGNATIPQNGTGIISIDMTNSEHFFTAFTFKLTLPEGLGFVLDTAGRPMFESSTRFSDHNVSSSASGQTATFACLSLNSTPIGGTQGTLLNVSVQPEGELAVGTVLPVMMSELTFTTPDEQEVTFNDITFTITIGEPDDGFIKFDETSTKLPTYTAGEKGNVRVKRTIKAGQWSTLVLPFNLTRANATKIFGEGYEMATFAGFQVDYGEDEENVTPLGIELNFSNYTIPARGNLAGGTPVLIKTAQDITEFELEDVTLVDAVTDVEKADEYGTAGKFTATLVKSVIPADGLFISDNKFYYSAGETNVKAFRGWFELGAVLDRETDFGAKVRFNIGEESTDIKDVQDEEAAAVKKGYYTLDGRKLNGKPTEKGIYIVDGKKVANY